MIRIIPITTRGGIQRENEVSRRKGRERERMGCHAVWFSILRAN